MNEALAIKRIRKKLYNWMKKNQNKQREKLYNYNKAVMNLKRS